MRQTAKVVPGCVHGYNIWLAITSTSEYRAAIYRVEQGGGMARTRARVTLEPC
jgi:hypothetical protein